MTLSVRVMLLIGTTLAPTVSAQTWPSDRPAAGRMAGFGSSMLIVGNDILVGRSGGGLFGGATPGSPRGGGVHVFRRGGDGNWTEATSVTPSDGAPGDGFGSSLAAAGDWLAVGAPSAKTGAVYLYQRAGSSWKEVARVALPDGVARDGFGNRLAMRADLLLIAAPGRDSARGAVYAVRRTGSSWSAPSLVGAGQEPNDRFGTALSLDGDRVLIAAPGPMPLFGGGPNNRPKPGTATLYQITATGFVAAGTLALSPADSVVALGTAVHLRGDDAFASAPVANRNMGAVHHFSRQADGSWRPAGILTATPPAPPAGPQTGMPASFQVMGLSITAAGDQMMIGAPFAGQLSGAVYVFDRSSGTWGERQKLTVTSRGQNGFGMALVASPTLAVVGAPGADFGEGLAHVFGRDGAEWKPLGRLVDTPYSLPAVTGGTEKKCQSGDIQGYTCQEVDLQAFLPISAIGGGRGVKLNDIWGWTDPETGKEWALVGRVDGTAFVDVSDPVNPRYAGDLPLTPGAIPNSWRDIKVYKNHAFVVADGAGQHGMQVFDLTRLRAANGAPVTFKADTVYDKIASAHNIAINEETGYAYPIGNSAGGETCGGGLHMIDIRDPKVPKFAGCWADKSTGNAKTGYTHDAMCVNYRGPDARYSGREICFNASETAVGIADLTDKAAPKRIAVAEYPNTAYAHQGWLSDDHKYFFLNDEGDEISGRTPKTRTLVWDVSKLDEPVLVKEFLGTTAASDHNLYIRGRYMYQSNYLAGLRVVDIADPVNPVEVGYLDTVPWGENNAGFEGSWSNYPYFKSGTIIVSSIGQGLFIVKHRKMSPVP
ncbi:MAG: choice-of-anchor B family protein [Gemmatimonadales bacterium]|nr:choice-of-anchor B family protein [Gemmatimonadales bacterium]